MPQVFIAYSRRNLSKVANLVSALENHPEINVWYAAREIRSGEDISERLIEGIHSSSVFLLCSSAFTTKSRMGFFLAKEQEEAVNKMRQDSSFHIIPVLIDKKAIIPKVLSAIEPLDLSSPNWRHRINRLIEQIISKG